jgi:hypothetical protein
MTRCKPLDPLKERLDPPGRSASEPQPGHNGKAEKARAKNNNGCGFGHGRHEFGDNDLAVAGLEIRYQDLVNARIEGAATTAGGEAVRPSPTAATAAVPTTAATTSKPSGATTTTESASKRTS